MNEKFQRAKWPEDTAERIMDMRQLGASWAAVGKSFGVDIGAIRNKAIKLGLLMPRKNRRFTPDDDAMIRPTGTKKTVEISLDKLTKVAGEGEGGEAEKGDERVIEEGDIVIDGGNSFSQDTRRREEKLRALNQQLAQRVVDDRQEQLLAARVAAQQQHVHAVLGHDRRQRGGGSDRRALRDRAARAGRM